VRGSHRTRRRQPGRKCAFAVVLSTLWPHRLAPQQGLRKFSEGLSPGAPSAHMAHPAALPGQPGRLLPALRPLRVQQQRLTAPAGRRYGPVRHRRRLMVAPEAPQERPAAPKAAALRPPPLTPLAQSAPGAATQAFSSVFENIAAVAKVRRH
jgi:hypothetical protein